MSPEKPKNAPKTPRFPCRMPSTPPNPSSTITSPPHALFLSTLVAPVFTGAFFTVPAGAFFAAGAAAAGFLAGGLPPFLTTVDAVSVLTLLEALTLLPALAVARAAPAPGPALAAVFALFRAAAVAPLTVEAAAALRVAPLRTDFAFSTMPERTPVRGAGFAGEEGRAMADFEGEAGRCVEGGRRELEEAGERIWGGALGARVRFLGLSGRSFSLSGPASSSLRGVR